MIATLPSDDQLQVLGMGAARSRPPSSDQRFPDGRAWRIAIPSLEGPEPLRGVVDQAARLDVRVHRVSQGSGARLPMSKSSEPLLPVPPRFPTPTGNGSG